MSVRTLCVCVYDRKRRNESRLIRIRTEIQKKETCNHDINATYKIKSDTILFVVL